MIEGDFHKFSEGLVRVGARDGKSGKRAENEIEWCDEASQAAREVEEGRAQDNPYVEKQIRANKIAAIASEIKILDNPSLGAVAARNRLHRAAVG